MFLIHPSYEILTKIDSEVLLKRLELFGRVCYKSESKITEDSAEDFVVKIIKLNHETILEHESLSIRFIVDRAIANELVRHRLASYSQESSRFVNYKDGVTFIIPLWVSIPPGRYQVGSYNNFCTKAEYLWAKSVSESEEIYLNLLKEGWTPQQARSVLPLSFKTEIICTANLREWRKILDLRTARAAHPQMRQIMIPLLVELRKKISVVFDDIGDLSI